MYSFKNDYSTSCHPKILKSLSELNNIQYDGYSEDQINSILEARIKEEVNVNSKIYLFSGGTQTNLTFISSVLRPHEGVISAATGHIATHETGAIEACGHKVIELKEKNGKINAEQIGNYLQNHLSDPTFEHTVKPKLVYLSQPTEYGTLYSKKELTDIKKFCQQYQLFLYIDGARMASALTSQANDVSLKDLGNLSDAFYLGGTKCGLLFGECLIINNPLLQNDFRYIIKQKGAMLAKGFILAKQFESLLFDLYYEIGNYQNKLARYLADELQKKGIKLAADLVTNQVFPLVKSDLIEKLKSEFDFHIWDDLGEYKVIRLCISFDTDIKQIDKLIGMVK